MTEKENKNKAAKYEPMERLKEDMAPVAAKIFRHARQDAYRTNDWIATASKQVVSEIVDRMFGILHSVAKAAEEQEKKEGGE